ncbi:MAG TPA: helix-turn-helix domain-containing protein [Woeseiaceae bacterium]
MSNFCARCGYNHEQDRALVVDGFRIELGQGASYGGAEILLSPMELSFLHSLASYPGRFMDGYVLLTRAGSESADAQSATARTAVAKYRRQIADKMEAAGVPNPIEMRLGYGLRWQPAEQAMRRVA